MYNRWTVCYNDLRFPKGIRQVDGLVEIGGNACDMPTRSNSVNAMVLHCAFEMFEGEYDGLLIEEAARVLKPGGKLIIVPLYITERYFIARGPSANTKGVQYDKGAEIFYIRNYGGKIRSCRIYNPLAFKKRVIRHSNELQLTVYNIKNLADVDQICYANYVAVFTKQ